MAKSDGRGKKPRIRKNAPTVREMVESARVKEEEPQPKKLKTAASKVARPIKNLRLGERRVIKLAAKPLRIVKKILSWIVPRYFVNAWREVRQVQWPGRRETWRLTLAVFVFAVIFGALVAGVDKGLDEVFKKVVLK